MKFVKPNVAIGNVANLIAIKHARVVIWLTSMTDLKFGFVTWKLILICASSGVTDNTSRLPRSTWIGITLIGPDDILPRPPSVTSLKICEPEKAITPKTPAKTPTIIPSKTLEFNKNFLDLCVINVSN